MDLPLPSSVAAPWLAPALWLVARGTVLLGAAALAALALRRGSAAARHMVWALALAAMLALPAASLLIPRWELSFVRLVAVDAPAGAAAAAAAGAGGGVDWSTLVLAVWLAGAAVTMGRYGVAMVSVRMVARGARRVTRGEWMDRLHAAARELGMRERVRLLRADGAAMPMTWGILHPAVLVPADADGWTAERKRVVLLHELAHVARRDCLWQTLASLCCAAYWFHPGVWWAARQMRIEREQACDDRVLRAGTRASDYAGHLLEVARSFRPRPLTAAAAVAMARRSQLEGRVLAVLDAARDRAAVPGRAALVAGGVAAVALFPLAAASPEGFEAPPPAPAVAVHPAVAAAPPPHALEWTVESSPAEREGAVSVPLASASDLRLNVRVKDPHASPASGSPAPARFPDFGPPDEPMLTALIRATHDVDPEVRRSAVSALGRMDVGGVVGPLVQSMGDTDARVRSAAALALGEYAGRTGNAARVAATRQPACEGEACAAEPRPRVPTGAATAPAPRPRNARTDMGGGGPTDPALRILGGLMEDDTLGSRELLPGIRGDEML
ncbi:MAG TPA: M56 family metallopeptidase [Longimicrobium sp.]|jgi:beta-lactamase regulating signal transducer with metallopeptidase domain|uniref:M56 family metallopeptidase n=1 Tax=Longimicrobium sp. TaxID=2029185 RepID=UPI002ED9F1CB